MVIDGNLLLLWVLHVADKQGIMINIIHIIVYLMIMSCQTIKYIRTCDNFGKRLIMYLSIYYKFVN